MIKRLARVLYGLKDDEIKWPVGLVVPLGYGFSKSGLPDAARKTTFEAAKIAEKFQTTLAYCNVDYLGPGMEEKEDAAKREILKNFNIPRIIVADPCQNSVTEARNIKKALWRANIATPSVVDIVCDWPHARRTHIIFEEIFYSSMIKIKSVEGEWDRTHLVSLQRSWSRWMIANILGHGALRVLGIDWVAKRQYTQK